MGGALTIGPRGRGFELSRRRKKRAIGTCPYSPVSEWSPLAGRLRGGALTIKGAFFFTSSVGSESAPHFNIGPCGRGFELSRRRKKRAIRTCPYSPVSEWSPPAGRPRGGALTVMVLIRNNLLDRLPTPFSGNSSYEIPFKNIFVFLLIFHVMHSPNF